MAHGFHVKEIATPVRTFYRRMKEIDVSIRAKYSNITITIADLEQEVTDISVENNFVGEKIICSRHQTVPVLPPMNRPFQLTREVFDLNFEKFSCRSS